MNPEFLLGSLYLRVTAVYGAETHWHLLMEGRQHNEEVYERWLKQTGWKSEELTLREQKPALWPPTIPPRNDPKQVTVTDREEAIRSPTR